MILLDAGHGGYFEGVTTSPHKGIYGETESFSEGQYNRLIVNGIGYRLSSLNVPFHIIAPENEDTKLHTRARRVNKLAHKFGQLQTFLLSVHQNGFHTESVKGFELFTSPGFTLSDTYAELIAEDFQARFPERVLRRFRESKVSKEARYYILAKTICPAVLTEWAFMTNKIERSLMNSDTGIMNQINFLSDMCANIYFNHIKKNFS